MVLIKMDQHLPLFLIGINIIYHIIQSALAAVQPLLLRSMQHSQGVIM